MACRCSVSSGGQKHVVPLRTRLIFCRRKACQANQHRGERGQLTPRMSNKTSGLFDSNVFFYPLPLLHKVQTKCDGSEEKQVILAVRAWVRHCTRHYFIYLGEVRLKCQLWNWPGVNVWSSATWGMASTVLCVSVIHPSRIWLQIVTVRGCKASCSSYLRQF